MNVVIDTNVLISAIFWPGESRECFVLWAKRRFDLAVTPQVFAEYDAVSRRMAARIPNINPIPWLRWIEGKAKVYDPAILTKRLSRDVDDDSILACALAASAKIVISKDEDLLVLRKPFGIDIVTPRRFLARLRA